MTIHTLELDEAKLDRLHQLAGTLTDDGLDIERVDDAWESMVSAAISLWEGTQRNYWKMGDLARKCEKVHGESSLKSLGNSVGIKKTMIYDLFRTAAFFPDDDLRERFQTLSWSHFREVTRLDDKVLDEFEVAMDLLEKAEDKHWTVEALRDEVNRLLKKDPAKKKFFAADAQIVSVDHAPHGMVHIVLEVAQDTDLQLLRDHMGELVIAKLYADPKPEADDAAAQ